MPISLDAQRRRLDVRVGQCRFRWVSAVEHRPADTIAQPLVVKDEVANRLWELLARPMALQPAGAFDLADRRSRAHSLDRVGGRTELMCGDMRHHCRLAGSICGVPSGSAQLSCRSHGMATRRAGLRHRDRSTRPCASLVNRLTRSLVRRSGRLEEVYDMLRARCGPQGEELMIGICKCPAAADGDETGIAVFGKDHGCTVLSASAQRLALQLPPRRAAQDSFKKARISCAEGGQLQAPVRPQAGRRSRKGSLPVYD
jgi:hypothetical protein